MLAACSRLPEKSNVSLLPQSLTLMTLPINKYKGTLPYLLMNVGGALLQMGLVHWYMYMLTKQPHLPSTKVNNSPSVGSVVVSVPLTKAEVSGIFDLKDSFDKPKLALRQDLDKCDSGCPNHHYTRVETRSFELYDVERQGHPLICSNDSGCSSKLRIFRVASTHFPVLRTLQRNLYSTLSSHRCIASIDKALNTGDFQALLEITKTDGLRVYSMLMV